MAKTTTTNNEVTFSKQSTKAGLIEYLRFAYKKGISDQSLKDTILYAGKKFREDEKKVTKTDLLDLCIKAQKLLAAVPVTAPVKPAVAVKPIEASTKTGKKSMPLAKIFPAEITTAEGIKLKAAHDKYKTVDEVKEAVENGVQLVFATYWTSRHLKQYKYAEYYKLKKSNPKVFPNDLDLMCVREVTDTEKFIIAVSAYTEAIGLFFSVDVPPVVDEDADGDKFSIRYSNGMEFEIYEATTADEEEQPEPEEPEKTAEEEPAEEPAEEEKPAPKTAPKTKVTRRKPKTSGK